MERGKRAALAPDAASVRAADTGRMKPLRLCRALCIAACLSPLLLAACTVDFTPGDAKPAVYTPYPAKPASSGMP